MSSRSFGWVQDAYRLDKARAVVELVAQRQPVVHAELLPLVRERLRIGRWADDNYVRFAHALGFIAYDRRVDVYSLTARGERLLQSPIERHTEQPVLPGFDGLLDEGDEWGRDVAESSAAEQAVYTEALLSYPPVARVLGLLAKHGHQTKFELGRELGFHDDVGFTSVRQERFVIAVERDGKSPHDFEGTSDKYARTIASWCVQMGWVERVPKTVKASENNRTYTHTIKHAYTLTAAGHEAVSRARGSSSHGRVAKAIPYEMLASGAQPNAELVRHRRAQVIASLRSAGSAGASADEIVEKLASRGVPATTEVVTFDVRCLLNLGLSVRESYPRYYLRDEVAVDVPALDRPLHTRRRDEIEERIVRLGARLRHVPDRYLDLVRLGFDPSRSADFEFGVFEVFRDLLGYDALKLGGGLAPDALAWYADPQFLPLSYGLIIDAKSSATAFSVDVSAADQMTRYVLEYQKELLSRHIPTAYFLFVGGAFSGPLGGLRLLHERTRVAGAAITIADLIHLAEQLRERRQEVTLRSVSALFGSLQLIDAAKIDALHG
ncbi:MAG: hypothetical protein HY329_25455 [Chloroflexi bacterium]|nr:hypothetical protein [Chloroflexota bacterium]